MKSLNAKIQKRTRRHAKIRTQISGTNERPRLSVYKSNKHISAQLINDDTGVTIIGVHSRDVKGKTMMEKAGLVGKTIAEKGKALKVSKVVFDRGGFIYTGCVKALADSAREGGLQF